MGSLVGSLVKIGGLKDMSFFAIITKKIMSFFESFIETTCLFMI
jgi:hypothetical protein